LLESAEYSLFILQGKKLSEDNVKDLSDEIQVSGIYFSCMNLLRFKNTQASAKSIGLS
jgi:hypothetical protein